MNIWILNHYAMPPSFGGLNRHHYFSKYLSEMGHAVRIITSGVIHNTDINMIKGREPYREQAVDGVEYTFVRGSKYKVNGLARIWNMLEFPVRMAGVCKKFPSPDIIYTSSPDILTVTMAILIAGRLKKACVVEIRDLWPESIVEYKGISRRNPFIKALYVLEKWIYRKADRLIFTCEGARDYIKERGWEFQIDQNKIYHINNGVSVTEFESDMKQYFYDDPDLEQNGVFKVGYAGSIRMVNHLEIVVEAAEILQREDRNVKFFIFGDGTERSALEQYARERQLHNIVFRGRVEGKYLPSVLRRCDINLLHSASTPLFRFGTSMNKIFTYMAAGKPILSSVVCNYDLISRYRCGTGIESQSPRNIASAVIEMASLDKSQYEEYCENALRAASDYDYRVLTEKLLKIFESAVKK